MSLALRHEGIFYGTKKTLHRKCICERYPGGRSGRRVRKQFATKGEALAFERHTKKGASSVTINLEQSTLLALVIKICLSTGARWCEAVNLTRSQVTKYRITFVRTKGKKNLSIPISKELYEEINALDGFKFFTDCYFQFLSVMDKTSIVLPRGQLTHVLRHTFAAHLMMSGENILALQKILGHHDIKMAMRYAHLSPDHLETALRFNPLATLPMAPTNFDMPWI